MICCVLTHHLRRENGGRAIDTPLSSRSTNILRVLAPVDTAISLSSHLKHKPVPRIALLSNG